MKTEDFIEKLIAQGKVDPHELQELIVRERAKSPFPALEAQGASLLLSNVLLESKVKQIESDQGALFMELIMQGVI